MTLPRNLQAALTYALNSNHYAGVCYHLGRLVGEATDAKAIVNCQARERAARARRDETYRLLLEAIAEPPKAPTAQQRTLADMTAAAVTLATLAAKDMDSLPESLRSAAQEYADLALVHEVSLCGVTA